jgi:hypothetical protein
MPAGRFGAARERCWQPHPREPTSPRPTGVTRLASFWARVSLNVSASRTFVNRMETDFFLILRRPPQAALEGWRPMRRGLRFARTTRGEIKRSDRRRRSQTRFKIEENPDMNKRLISVLFIAELVGRRLGPPLTRTDFSSSLIGAFIARRGSTNFGQILVRNAMSVTSAPSRTTLTTASLAIALRRSVCKAAKQQGRRNEHDR